MSEPQGSPPPDEKPATNGALVTVETPKPVREIRVVSDPIPVLDTAKFEHMQRIATAMATMQLLPDSLRIGRVPIDWGDDGKITKFQEVLLPFDVVQARCFMITNQAVRWEMDPFAVAQCVSFVHGKLMYEGKLVAAVIEAKTGIRLKFTYSGEARARTVVVSGRFRDETEPRTISGTVDQWHKGDKSAWNKPADWDRQLAYMGARVWARIHAPGVMLGVITDDEADESIGNRHMGTKVAIEAPDLPDDDEPAEVEAKLEFDEIKVHAAQKNGKPPVTTTGVLPGAHVRDPDRYLESLRDMISSCGDLPELDHIEESNAAIIEALPAHYRSEARKLIQAARDGE